MPELYTITVGPCGADFAGNTNDVIQAAVDRAALLGRGTVHILPGIYIMNDSLHLRSGVAVKGSGDSTVLLKPPSISSPIDLFLGYGHYDVSVVEPEKFEIGMGIRISDNASAGFYNTVATVTGKSGSELLINRMLNHDYHPAQDAKVVSVYPVVSGYDIEDVSVSDLMIDGNGAENEFIDGCRGGGVFLIRSRNAAVRNVTVRNYNGDGISFQQSRNTLIENCRCTGNTGSGLHPGSGSVGAVMRNNICCGNGSDGIYYCLRVSYSLCEGCTIEGNGRDGISIGHRDNDNVIINNVISDNMRHGIYFRRDPLANSGLNTVISGNRLRYNGSSEGAYQIFTDCSVSNLHLLDNEMIANDDLEPLIYLNARPERLFICGGPDNSIAERVACADEEYLDAVCFKRPAERLEAGPDYATADSAHHLNPSR